MKKILMVGNDYNYKRDVVKKYKDYLFVNAIDIDYDSAERIIAMVEMVDAILVISNTDDFKVEAIAILLNKDIYTADEFPVNEEKEDAGDL